MADINSSVIDDSAGGVGGVDGDGSPRSGGGGMADLEEGTTIVIDNGSGYIKAGLSTDENPTVVFPTIVGRPRRRYEELYAGQPPFVGEQAIANRNHLSFTHPIDHGHIDDWMEMEEVWNHTFKSLAVTPSELPVLMTEPPLCSSKHREKLAEAMFDVFNVPELNISVTGLMAIYGRGQITGFVLDIGEGITQCVPVFEGFLEKTSVRRSDFGGQELQMYLQKILCDMGYGMTSRDDYEHVRVLKETLCFCSTNPQEDQERTDLEKTYHLPDGLTLRDGVTNEITLGPERFYPAEALFNPQLCGRDNPPLMELVWSSVSACPIENRKALTKSVVLSGGTSMFPGFDDRLQNEMMNTAPENARASVRVIADDDRANLVWRGARVFSGADKRPMQSSVWISKDEWDEVGPSIVHKKAALKV